MDRLMNGWMDGVGGWMVWIDGWVDGRMDGWIIGWLDRWLNKAMDE